jgi:hypothetical protein
MLRYLVFLFAPVLATAADAPSTFHFDFSSAPAAAVVCSKETGFDLGTKPAPGGWGVSSDKPSRRTKVDGPRAKEFGA